MSSRVARRFGPCGNGRAAQPSGISEVRCQGHAGHVTSTVKVGFKQIEGLEYAARKLYSELEEEDQIDENCRNSI